MAKIEFLECEKCNEIVQHINGVCWKCEKVKLEKALEEWNNYDILQKIEHLKNRIERLENPISY